MSNPVLDGYAAASEELIPKYEAISPEQFYAPVSHLTPRQESRIVDLGAGPGRDAAWFAGQGHNVLAVEPVSAFRKFGMGRQGSQSIEWMSDELPEIDRVLSRDEEFNFVLLNAVWHHLDNEQRAIALPRLERICAPDGIIILSVRNGPGSPFRRCFEVSVEETITLAAALGLRAVLVAAAGSLQSANKRNGVSWTWLAFSKS